MRKKNGFTLIELMVVIAIIGILTAIVVPNYIRYRNNQQVLKAARSVYSALQSAKETAIRDSVAINVLFSVGNGANGTYQIFEDENDNGTLDAGEEISSGGMPPGISLTSAPFNGVANSTIFSPLGLTTGEDGSVIVTNGDQKAEVFVNQAGGIRVVYE